MKLELKHIVPYLPYELEVLDALNQKVKVIGVKNETYFIDGGNVYAYGDIQDCKPILHPLSDLTKEIEVNGENFVPNKRLKFGENKLRTISRAKILSETSYRAISLLIEWHFDVFGLIEAGLAISIHDISKIEDKEQQN